MKSAAVIGVPSDQTAFGLRVYRMVSGEVSTSSACSTTAWSTVGCPLGCTTKALGSTGASTSWLAQVSP